MNSGISARGALGRIGDGKFEGKTSYEEFVIDKKGDRVIKINTEILEDHFMQPKPVMFAHLPPIPPKVIAVACGLYHIVVVARDPQNSHGKLYTSGLNNYGQLGHGDTENRDVLTLVRLKTQTTFSYTFKANNVHIFYFISLQVEDKKDDDFGYVAAGESFSLALTHDRQVLYSFGRSDYGQLGLGYNAKIKPDAKFTTPQVVRFPKSVDIVSISAGDRHASAVTSDHECYTWGYNEEGPTGHQNISTKAQGFTEIYDPTLLKLEGEPECYPVQFSGGGQHSLLLVRPKLAE